MEERKKQGFFSRLAASYRKIPDKKPYIEFVTAILSIPVLLTVILLNFNALRSNKNTVTPTPAPAPRTVIITEPSSNNQANTAVSPTQQECTPEVGPVTITSPNEGDTVTDNPVFVGINYKQGDFCSVVWSYRINGGVWSDYDDQSVSLYNPPPGNIRFELRVKSVVGSDSRTLTRNFIYQGNSITQVTPPTASSSAK